MPEITVMKLDLQGQETWRYTGQVLARDPRAILLEARFNRADLPFHGVLFRNDDRFLEAYYTDRWYNIFEVHDKDDDRIKCWYSNVACPATITKTEVAYVDLALDLLVFPDGRQEVLDEDEFAALSLSEADRHKALRALQELKELEWKPLSQEFKEPG
ncbi:MAG: DUF402 domain-containing protein [Anaerolineaceae bacterium]|nr:DUF402 domain-containing protein [Anaerolineaceae bacterium]